MEGYPLKPSLGDILSKIQLLYPNLGVNLFIFMIFLNSSSIILSHLINETIGQYKQRWRTEK